MTVRAFTVVFATLCASAATPESALWSLRPIERPSEPHITNASWSRNSIDKFILARLEREGMRPAPEANAATLLRRVTLDLTGLPPAPEEVAAFLADQQPGAWDRIVDRLLASQHHGEKWGRH